MSWLELIGALVSAWAVWLAAQRRLWAFPIGLASVILYVNIFIDARLYSDALLQVVFGALIIYGWVRWLQNMGLDSRVRVAPLPRSRIVAHLWVGAVGALALGFAMHRWTDAALPWLDAALTSFSLVAQWWQDRRHTAAWWLWIVVDVIYVGEYIYKSLLITAVLYAVFVVLAVIGLRNWLQASRTVMQAIELD